MRGTGARRTPLTIALGALLGSSLVLAGGAEAETVTSYSAECEATLLSLRVDGQGGATPSAQGCRPGSQALLPPIDLTQAPGVPLAAHALHASTHADPPSARAGVARVLVPLHAPSGGELPDIAVDVVTSDAWCSDGAPGGTSRVVNVAFGASANNEATALAVPEEQAPTARDVGPLRVLLNDRQVGSTTSTSSVGGTTTVTTTRSLTQTALRLTTTAAQVPVVDLVISRAHVACTTTTRTTTRQPPGAAKRWMSGGGQLHASLTHAFVLPCTTTQGSPGPKLQLETPKGRFVLTSLGSVTCTADSAEGSPEQPQAGFNTLSGKGTGSCGGVSGVPVDFRFTDEGEANRGVDEAAVTIQHSACPVSASGTVNGNHQAHRGATSSR